MNGYESVENRWLKPGSLPPVAFMGTSGKWGFHGYEFVVLQCHKPPIGDGLLVKLGMLYDWHPIIAKLDRARCFSSAYPFVRSGRERKKVFFSIFPVFCGEKVCRNKKNTRAFGQRKKKRKKTIFRPRRERKKTIFRPGTERKKEKKNDFSRFSRGKGMQKQKKHACVRAEKEKKKIFRFFPFFARKRYAETKKNTRAFGQRKKKRCFFDFSRFSRGKGMQKQKKTRVRSGRERKKVFFSIFPVFSRGKGMQKKKCNTCVRAEKHFRFFLFFARKRSVETIKKWNDSNKWSERNN